MTAERDEHGHAVEWRPMTIHIQRMHLEEDAGKNVHEGLPETDQIFVHRSQSGRERRWVRSSRRRIFARSGRHTIM